jgi:hypothetical protein
VDKVVVVGRGGRVVGRRVVLALVTGAFACLGPASVAGATTFLVTNNRDSGSGSLRQAILSANAATTTSPPNAISVPSGTGALVITPASPLPALTVPVVLAGVGKITINDANAGASAVGIELAPGSGGSMITGVTIMGSGGAGILAASSGNVIAGDNIGSLSTPNHAGIIVQAASNRIGGSSPEARNLISGNTQEGVLFSGSASTGNVVEGNFIGSDGTGRGAIPNLIGVAAFAGASANTIGGTVYRAGNLISGNKQDGVLISGRATTHNAVQGNLIGVQINRLERLSNGTGLLVTRNATGNLIGGDKTGAGNMFRYEPGGAVVVNGTGTAADAIRGNSMAEDGPLTQGPGIRLTNGGNGNEPPAHISSVVTTATATTISGTGARGSHVEVFANPNCHDPEGEQFLASTTTTSSGAWTASTTPVTTFTGVTATQTASPTPDTSPFSNCLVTG